VSASGASVVIQSRVDEGAWTERSAIYPLKGERVLLKVDEVPDASIRWYRVLPELSRRYSNARRAANGAHQWSGYDRILYQRVEITELRDRWEIEPFRVIGRVGFWERIMRPLRNLSWRLGGPVFEFKEAGSFWFQAEIHADGRVARSPGIEDSDERGLSPRVFRVSIRDGEGYLGYVSSYLNVPGLFGSVNYQSENYIGVDCADVLVAAHARMHALPLERNYNVAGLVDELKHVVEFDVERGRPSEALEWGTDIRPGDLIAVKYRGSYAYGHIGALYRDSNWNGQLDRWDLVLHAGPAPLHYSPLKWGAFEGHVVVLRFEGSS